MLKGGKAPGLIQEKMTTALKKGGEDPAGFKFHSGEIIELMQDTLKQIKALSASLEEAEKECGEKEAAKATAEEDKLKTTEDKTADNTFMDDLTSQCEEKAVAWDARSKTRSTELTAIAGAIATLKGEVSGK